MSDTDPCELYEPDGEDLDRMTRAQLAELPGPASALAEVLDDWRLRLHGLVSTDHGVGMFLELLAAEGWQVTPIEVTESPLLPPPTE